MTELWDNMIFGGYCLLGALLARALYWCWVEVSYTDTKLGHWAWTQRQRFRRWKEG